MKFVLWVLVFVVLLNIFVCNVGIGIGVFVGSWVIDGSGLVLFGEVGVLVCLVVMVVVLLLMLVLC